MCFLFASFSFAFRWNGLALFESHVRTIHCSQFAFFFLCGFLRQRRTVCSGSPFFSSVLPCGNYFTCELLRMEPVAQLTIPIATKHSILQTHICEPDQLLLFLCQFGWFSLVCVRYLEWICLALLSSFSSFQPVRKALFSGSHRLLRHVKYQRYWAN